MHTRPGMPRYKERKVKIFKRRPSLDKRQRWYQRQLWNRIWSRALRARISLKRTRHQIKQIGLRAKLMISRLGPNGLKAKRHQSLIYRWSSKVKSLSSPSIWTTCSSSRGIKCKKRPWELWIQSIKMRKKSTSKKCTSALREATKEQATFQESVTRIRLTFHRAVSAYMHCLKIKTIPSMH